MLSTIALLLFFGFILMTVLLPESAVAVFLILSTFETSSFEAFGFHLTIPVWSQLYFLAGCVIRQWITKEEINRHAAYPALAIAVASCLSIPFSIHPGAAFLSSIQVMCHAILFYFVFDFIQTSSNPKSILNIPYYLIFLFLFYGFFQWINRPLHEPFHLHAGMDNWNILAAALVAFLPYLMIKLNPLQFSKSFFIQTAWFLILLVLIAGTQSRSGLIILILSFIIMALHGLLDRRLIYFAISMAAVMMVSAVVFELSGLFSVSGAVKAIINSPRIQERAQNAVLTLMTLAKHPFTGIGLGQWEAYSIWAYPDLTFSIRTEYSSFLVWLAETGLIGGMAYIYLFQCIFTHTTQSAHHQHLYTAVYASLWILAAASLLYAVHLHVYIWCWLGLTGGLIARAIQD